jgi:hypothetical protein
VQEYNEMLNGTLPSETVALHYIDSFMELVAPLVDMETLIQYNRTFDAMMVIDPRHPAAATRQHGLINTCTRCTNGAFIDERTHRHVRVYDWRFQAARAFAFIGYALAQLGHECTGLWNPAEPQHLNYGPYSRRPCAPLPSTKDYFI